MDHEDPRPAAAVERLDDQRPTLGVPERAQVRDARRDDRGRYEVGETQGEELLVRLAQPARVVDEHASAADVLEQRRRVEVVHVERRIRPDEDDVVTLDRHRAAVDEVRHEQTADEGQARSLGDRDLVTTPAQLFTHRRGAVARRIDARRIVREDERPQRPAPVGRGLRLEVARTAGDVRRAQSAMHRSSHLALS